MKQQKYDIFISYRRIGGAQYARTLQLMLEKKGYKVFLDYDELIDDVFSPQIEAAIKNSTIYMILLTKGSLERCANEGDWVRREIQIAVENGKRIIPVNPDGTYDGMPENVPQFVKSAIADIQHSDIAFGQTLNATVDLMVKNRIKPYIHPHHKRKWLWAGVGMVLLLAVIGPIIWHYKTLKEIGSLKQEITFKGRYISWPVDISKTKLLAIKDLLDNMELIEGGEFYQGALPLLDGSYHEYVEKDFETPAFKTSVESFYISKFEVTRGQWNAIMNDNREGDPNLPIDFVTFNQAKDFAKELFEITGLLFKLPTESEWEYAAKGGAEQEGFMFAGSDDPEKVAWYAKNSGRKRHSNLPETPTVNDIFNMSGNVSEWCDTDFKPYDENIPMTEQKVMVVRGGNSDSEEYEITTTHREPMRPDTALPTLGFRLVIKK